MKARKLTQNALAKRLQATKKASTIQKEAPVEEDSDGSDFDFDNAIPETTEAKDVKMDFENQEESDDDEDRELQIALRDGLLKPGLNYQVQKKRLVINKQAEMKSKLAEFVKALPWVETLDVSTPHAELDKTTENDDFQRELSFYKQAEKAVQIAVPRLLNTHIKILRPTDYYAEMAKSDEHMQKVRKRLLSIQEGKDRQEAYRRMREEKKFAAKVQKEVNQNKLNDKKKLAEAVKKHKKGMKQQLEDMLNNVKKMGLDNDDDDQYPTGPRNNSRGGFSRGGFRGGATRGGALRNKGDIKKKLKADKFGYGGQKKGRKRTNADSLDDFGSYRGRGGGRGGFSRGGRGGSRGRRGRK